MSQETISHQGDTTNNAKFFQKRFIFGKVFGRLTIKLKNVRKKNNKSKCQLEEINNRKTNPTFCNGNSDIGEDQSRLTIAGSSTLASSSSVPPLPDISDTSVSQPVTLTSVTSFSDDDPTLTVDSSSKSASLLNDGSILRHKTSAISEAFTITSSEDLEAPKLLKKNSRFNKKLFIFSKRKSIENLRNNNSIITINSSVNEGSSCEDSAYETEPELETSYLKKKENKNISQKIQDKIIKKTKLTTLSSKDEEYIEIQKFFKVGLKNNKIHGIVRLQMPTKIVEAHEQFKKQVAQANNLSESKVCHRMFHGTKTAAFCKKPQHFINNKITSLCKHGCGVCGIIQEGNRTKYSHYTQRMWFANNSATSLSYCSSSKVKAMFVVDVIAASPSSILIIDKDEATIPRYLIIFQ